MNLLMTGQGSVSTYRAEDEYYLDEGCYINELSSEQDDPVMSIARARVEPGNITRWHSLRETSERYVIISGSGLVETGDRPQIAVAVGDVVLIPAGVRQRIRNTGEDDLIFLAICSPRFHPDNYLDCDEPER